MFLLVSVRSFGAHPGGHQDGVSIQISINLGKTFLRISRKRNILLTWILARVFVFLPRFISQIPDFIYWTVFIFFSDQFCTAWHWKPSLRRKRFCAVQEQRMKNKSHSFHISPGQCRESRSSTSFFLCSQTKRKRLLRRLLKTSNCFLLGGLAIAVPGEVKGLYRAWKEYGWLPWKDLVQPAINLAREGFEISTAVADALNDHMVERIKTDPGLRWAIAIISWHFFLFCYFFGF